MSLLSPLSRLIADTAFGSVLTAAVVCLVMAVIVVFLLRRAETCNGRQKAEWGILLALVAGTGVWTTHFVAILGYRPDALLNYSVETTLISALVGLVCVGGPLARSCWTQSRPKKAAWGGLAGAGVGAMHFTGMRALEGCSIGYNPAAVALATGFGVACFAAALGVRRRLVAGRTLLMVLGVCALHFTAMAGVTLELMPASAGRTFDASLLSALVTTASLSLSIVALFVMSAARQRSEERRLAAEAETKRNRIFSVAMRNMSNGLVMIDRDGIIIAFNDRAVELNDLARGELREGRHLEEFLVLVGRRNGWDRDRLKRVTENHRIWIAKTETTHVEHKFESGRVIAVACRPMADGGAVFTYDDVTERHSAEATITEMAYHDALTGLPNRKSFRETVAAELGAGTLRTLLLLDLDRFKTANETLGHQGGDRLLVQVAERLGSLTPRGRLFRIGGDGLAALPHLAGVREARTFADRLVEAFEASFVVNGHNIRIGCSVGVACAEDGDDAELLMQKADLALYRAKGLGRNRVDVYEAGMMEEARERRQLELDLDRALEGGQLFLQYQPLCRLPGERLDGFEALVRWRHPERGLVSPAEFIPLAEENAGIVEMGAWILDEACRQAARWPDDIHIAVNVSVVQMRRPAFVDQIEATLTRHNLAPRRLELELTETAMVEDGQRIAESLRALRRLGVRIAMDDFGTGYSSLAHLRQFEIDRIKIDRSFVAVADRDREARAVVRAVTSMAREMSLVTTGEGVSTPEQLQLLIELGCDTAQGYYIGRPVDATVADRLVAIRSFDDDAEADASTSGSVDHRAVGT